MTAKAGPDDHKSREDRCLPRGKNKRRPQATTRNQEEAAKRTHKLEAPFSKLCMQAIRLVAGSRAKHQHHSDKYYGASLLEVESLKQCFLCRAADRDEAREGNMLDGIVDLVKQNAIVSSADNTYLEEAAFLVLPSICWVSTSTALSSRTPALSWRHSAKWHPSTSAALKRSAETSLT